LKPPTSVVDTERSPGLRRRDIRDERFRLAGAPPRVMSGDNNAGLMSSAGLVRYFDAEDRNAIRFDPRSVIAFGVLFGVGIELLNLLG